MVTLPSFVPKKNSLLLFLFFGLFNAVEAGIMNYTSRDIDPSAGEKVDLDLNKAVQTLKFLEAIETKQIPDVPICCKYGRENIDDSIKFEHLENGNLRISRGINFTDYEPGNYYFHNFTLLCVCAERKISTQGKLESAHEIKNQIFVLFSALCALFSLLNSLRNVNMEEPRSIFSTASPLCLFIKSISMFITVVWSDELSCTQNYIVGYLIQFSSMFYLCCFFVENLDDGHVLRTSTENYYWRRIFKNTIVQFVCCILIFAVLFILIIIQLEIEVTPIVPFIIENYFWPHTEYKDFYLSLTIDIISGILLVCAVIIKLWRSVDDFPITNSTSMDERRDKDSNIILRILILNFILEVMSKIPESTSDFEFIYEPLNYCQGIIVSTICLNYTDVKDTIVFFKPKFRYFSYCRQPANEPANAHQENGETMELEHRGMI